MQVIVDEIADNLDARPVDGPAKRTTQHVEMAARHARLQMHARLDHRLAAPLRSQRVLNGTEDFIIGQVKLGYVEPVEKIDIDRGMDDRHGQLSISRCL